MSICPVSPRPEEAVLERIRPSRAQLRILHSFYQYVASSAERCLGRHGLRGEATLQGSTAKGTLLSDKWEIDVFLIIDGVDRDWIDREAEPLLKRCAREIAPFVARYSEHPYLRLYLSGLEADLVPVARPEPGRLEGLGVERTPLHTEYVKKRLSPTQRDEVRLLKSFLRGIGAYGAETHVRGFSGYLAELLVISFGTFRGVLQEASRWRRGERIYIDPEGIGDRDALKRRYRDSPLIVVDPVDPARNAAAAVSREKLALFSAASKLYLQNPHPGFFHACQPPPPHGNPVEGHVLRVICSGKLEEEPPDSIWGRLARASRLLAQHLTQQGFRVLALRYSSDEAREASVSVLLEDCRLPPSERMQGPPLWAGPERLARFIAKRLEERGAVWIEGEVLSGARPRRFDTAVAAAVSWLRSPGSKPLRSLGSICRVECSPCPGDEACWPTPAWIALAFGAPGRRH